MGRRFYASGRTAADTALDPIRPRGVDRDNVTRRLANIAVPKTTAEQRADALAYLVRTGNADLADALGLASP